MILNIIAIAMIALPTFFWATSGKGRGFFSSFLNMVCVLVAGAIAFGLWESVANALLGAAGSGGLLDSIAWGAGLLIPFIVSLAMLRFALDTFLGANVFFSDTMNLVGGALCGLVAAIITTGVIMTAFQFMGTGRAFAGYAAVTDDRGNLVYDKPLWVPADKLTCKLYEYMSLGGFRTSTPLALVMPAANVQGAMSRHVYVGASGMGRFGLKPDDFEVLGRYTVEGSGNALLADANLPDRVQTVKMPDGSTPPAGSTIEGVAVRLRSGAVERSGSQVVFGAGQARLIVRKPNTDDALGLQPIAIIAPPEGGGGFYRFRIDANDIFVPTVGGAAENIFVFEFVVPPGYQPTFLTLKNARKDIAKTPTFDQSLNGWQDRDDLLSSGELLSQLGIKTGGAIGNIDTASAVTLRLDPRESNGEVRNSSALPNNYSVKKDDTGGLGVEPDGDGVSGGSATLRRDQLENKGIDRKLLRDRFASTRTTGIVQVELASSAGLSTIGEGIEAADANLAPLLLASTGETFQPIGYVEESGELIKIRFTPNSPLRTIRDLPIQLSRTKRDQNLILVYRPTKGVRLVGFVLVDANGDGKQLATFSPPVEVNR
ncbi:MAG: hypothetical protein KDA20_00635 [Phycisphaerales bacterium]|nr:hypothetical protein [Phycisphaerales bacterium]